jgi:hypothetical protein
MMFRLLETLELRDLAERLTRVKDHLVEKNHLVDGRLRLEHQLEILDVLHPRDPHNIITITDIRSKQINAVTHRKACARVRCTVYVVSKSGCGLWHGGSRHGTYHARVQGSGVGVRSAACFPAGVRGVVWFAVPYASRASHEHYTSERHTSVTRASVTRALHERSVTRALHERASREHYTSERHTSVTRASVTRALHERSVTRALHERASHERYTSERHTSVTRA